MVNPYAPQGQEAGLTDQDFRRLSEFIYRQTGIVLTDDKRGMLTARIQKRLRLLHMNSFTEYCAWVLSPEGAGDEMTNFIDIVTTNKTDFFREPQHFDYLVKHALPNLIKHTGAGVRRKLMVWSAGCSSGEEPYTLAMVLGEFAAHYPGFNFSYLILGTDISTRVLAKARDAVYDLEKVAPVPLDLKRKYLLRSRNRQHAVVRIAPEVREMVRFRQVNFMNSDFGLRERMDVVFCRNVIIYFDRKTQESLVNKFCRYMNPGAYLFVGHSESLHSLDVPLTQVAPTVYQYTEAA